MTDEKERICCSCRESQDKVSKLVDLDNSWRPSGRLFICDNCVAQAVYVLGYADKEWRGRQIDVLTQFRIESEENSK